MTLDVQPFNQSLDDEWDSFISVCPSKTFLHTRRFLNQHEGRLEDLSVIVREDDRISAVIPSAVIPSNPKFISSHPGATYGGLLVRPGVDASSVLAILKQITDYYGSLGYAGLVYKAVPSIYSTRPFADDLYALWRLGAKLVRRDLSSTIDTLNRGPLRKRRERDIRSRLRSGLEIKDGPEVLEEVWSVVVENRLERFGVQPTHSYAEINSLMNSFKDEIRCCAALWEDKVVAGCVVFRTDTTDHLQYMANNSLGRKVHALDALVEHAIGGTVDRGARYFDFGISTEANGTVLNSGLHTYKSSFGAGTTIYDHYELPLS